MGLPSFPKFHVDHLITQLAPMTTQQEQQSLIFLNREHGIIFRVSLPASAAALQLSLTFSAFDARHSE
jgi:hypothetical protein